MNTISLCLIVKNEEAVLEKCLDSVKDIVDEIIIVDTGSTDNTKVIAERYYAKIYDFKWCNDFSKARNYSFSFATKDYILWLDADDFLPEIEIQKLQKLKLTAFVIPYANFEVLTYIEDVEVEPGVSKNVFAYYGCDTPLILHIM